MPMPMPMPVLPALVSVLPLHMQAAYLATWQPGTWTGRIHSIVDKGMDADTLGGLGDRCPCQNVPTVLVAHTTVLLVGQLAPRMWLHQAERERVIGVGMWPR